ncbi:MAG: amino acid permease [Pirellulales bacterium]|nr:amino acid permease [Pirellulales bacterium]
MSTSRGPSGEPAKSRLGAAAGVIVVSSVMFTFISYWRTAAIVLSDLGSTAYYIGGIVEQAIGPAAPWFILAVMLFSYAVRSVYIESVSMFVRGGVYRVTREALGGMAAKVAVSALLFDYVLTGPISSVSAGQYIIGLLLELAGIITGQPVDPATRKALAGYGSMFIAIGVTLYFYRQNLLGIHESSDKAMKIMIATTVMAVVVLSWGLLTLAIDGPRNSLPLAPDLTPKMNYTLGHQASPLGFLEGTSFGNALAGLGGGEFLSFLGLFGILAAFGHSILAMSGEETLAQVYREVESPKLINFKKAAFVVFLYSLIFTAGVSFLAVLLVPDEIRMARYADNLIGGLAMSVVGPVWLRLLLNGLVVMVGFLILSGAVNTAIIGSNGVLNRVAEDGVVPAWLQKPHPHYGTTYRILTVIAVFQIATILASRGDVIVLGEAYAFGVVWSFVFMSASMLVLRFKDRTPRQFKVPLNLRLGGVELPIGLGLVVLVLFLSAIANLLTKETATKWGVGFTLAFLTVFVVTEQINHRRRRGREHEHLEQFNRSTAPKLSREDLGLVGPYCKLVAIRSPQSLSMLEKTLVETDPETTSVVVMTARQIGGDAALDPSVALDPSAGLGEYDQQLMTAVVQCAEMAGKPVTPLIVPTNNPLHAVLRTAADLNAQEVVVGASNKYTAEEQMDQVSLYWVNICPGEVLPLTVRIISRNRDMAFDLGGGNRIPKISERKARSVAELRAAGVGADRVLLVYDGSPASHDLFQSALTMLDPDVALTLAWLGPSDEQPHPEVILQTEQQWAQQLRREMQVARIQGEPGESIVALAHDGQYDLIILPVDGHRPWQPWVEHVLSHTSRQVLLAPPPLIPAVTDDA